jgi:signal peptidase I
MARKQRRQPPKQDAQEQPVKRREPEAQGHPEAQPVRQSAKHVAMGWVQSILIALAIWFVLQALVVKSYRVDSGSMEPTLYAGDWFFINRVVFGSPVPLLGVHTPKLRDPERGEVIVIKGVLEPILTLVKRVIAVAGDTVELRADSLYRNGVYVPEPYVQHVDPRAEMGPLQRDSARTWQLPYLVAGVDTATYRPGMHTFGPVVVPPDHLFTLGDNRDESYDGRNWGFLPRSHVVGRPLFIYYSYDPTSWRPLPFITAIRWRRILGTPW